MKLRHLMANIPNDLYYEKLEGLLYQMAEIYDQVGDPNRETD